MLLGRFLDQCRSLAAGSTRRDLMTGLAVGFGLGSAYPILETEAKKKKRKKRKPRKPKPNAFGCLNVGKPCKSADQCCSGICDGKKRKRKCVAHGTGTCDQQGPEICVPDPPIALTCNNDATCRCFRTTGDSIVCAKFEGPASCVQCARDADCEAAGLPAGSSCVPFSEGPCAGNCASGMACVVPCGVDLPEPAP
jgi:hypothetical protein